jgi:hypothetical protein
LAFGTNVDPGEMKTASRGMPAKVMQAKTEMIGTAASGMVQGVQSEMNVGMIGVGSKGMINTGNHEGSGDGRGRGQWMQEMTEMKSDVEWVDTPVCISRPPSWIPPVVRC